MKNKILIGLSGIGTAIVGFVSASLAHAQAFAVTSSTEQTNNGAFLQMAYDHTFGLLGPTGGVLFLIVMTILGIVVWMAVKAPRHVVNA